MKKTAKAQSDAALRQAAIARDQAAKQKENAKLANAKTRKQSEEAKTIITKQALKQN